MNKTFIIRGDKSRSQVKRNFLLYAALTGLDQDKHWQVQIAPYKDNKTAQQRAFFHLLCGVFSAETGYSKDEIKQLCKAECFGTHEVVIGSAVAEVVKSSEKAKLGEYSDLIETCYRLAAYDGHQSFYNFRCDGRCSREPDMDITAVTNDS